MYAIGGTLFSDLLLHNKHFITYSKLNEEMYELIETDGKRNYYQTKYNLKTKLSKTRLVNSEW